MTSPMASLHPKVTTSNGPIDGAALLDDSLNTSVKIAAPKDGGPAWLQYEFDQPYHRARAVVRQRRKNSGRPHSGKR